MSARLTPRDRRWACPIQAGFFACVIALLMGETRGRIDRLVCDPRASYPRVRHLDFSLGDPGADGLHELAGASELRGLDLFGTPVDDDSLKHLGGLTELKTLYLESTAIGDDGLAHLGRLTRLRALALSGTKVTDAGLAHLKRLTGLQVLDLSYTAVTDAGIADLQGALPGTEITTERGGDAAGTVSTSPGGSEGTRAGTDPM